MKAVFVLFFLLIVSNVSAQRYTYYFDENLQSVPKNNALLVGYGIKTREGVTVDFLVAKTGKKLFTADFTDSTLNYMNGRNLEYDDAGRPVQSTYYRDNTIDGLMQKWDASGKMTDSIIYSNGKMINKTKFNYTKEGILVNYNLTDSVNDRMNIVNFDSSRMKISEILFTGNRGVLSYFKNGSIYKSDSLFTREEIDASFPGGPAGWRKHLEKYLDGDLPVRKGAGPGKYTVIIQFVVDTLGNISDIKPKTNLGYGMEEEAMKVIRKSPKWNPASQYGRKVKGYRLQPIIFQVIDQRKKIFDNPPSAQRPFGY